MVQNAENYGITIGNKHSLIHSFIIISNFEEEIYTNVLVCDSCNLAFLDIKGKIFNLNFYARKRKRINKLGVQDLFCFPFVYNVIN